MNYQSKGLTTRSSGQAQLRCRAAVFLPLSLFALGLSWGAVE